MNISKVSASLPDDYVEYINDMLLKTPFSFHRGLVDPENEKGGIGFTHPVLLRPDEAIGDTRVVSINAEFLIMLFNFYMKESGFAGAKYEILRISINATVPNVDMVESDIHVDHPFNHKQLLISLNDQYTGGGTVIYPNYPDLSESATIDYGLFEGAFFDSCWHSSKFPEKGVRIMAVYTFSMEE